MAANSAAVRSGADLRVDSDPQTFGPAKLVQASEVQGIDGVAAARTTDIEIGAAKAQMVSILDSRVDSIVNTAGGAVALAPLHDAFDATQFAPFLELEPGTSQVTVKANATTSLPELPSFDVGMIVMDATGATTTIPLAVEGLSPSASTAPVSAVGELPEGSEPWRVVAIVGNLSPTPGRPSLTVALEAMTTDTGQQVDVVGVASLNSQRMSAVAWIGNGQMPGDDGPPVPAVITTALAEQLNIEVGSDFTFRYAGTGREGAAKVQAIQNTLPGISDAHGVYVPTEALIVSQILRGTSVTPANSIWASGATASASALSAATGDRVVLTSTPELPARISGTLVAGWLIAAGGAIVLALIAALAIVQTLGMSRRGEAGVLRALGVAVTRQAGMRAGELAAVFGVAGLVGAAIGVGASSLIIPALISATTPGVIAGLRATTIEPTSLTIAGAAFVLGLAVVVAIAVITFVRSARGATVGEESR